MGAVLCVLHRQPLGKVLLQGLVIEARLLHPHPKLRLPRLVRHFGLNLPLAKPLRPHLCVKADTLQGRLLDKIVSALVKEFDLAVIRLATRHQPLIAELVLKGRTVALQLRGDTGHDRLLARHTGPYGQLCEATGVDLLLEAFGRDVALCVTVLTFLRAVTDAAYL